MKFTVGKQDGYTANRRFSDEIMQEVCRCLGPMVLRPASHELDTQEATDLVMLDVKDIAIGVRVRRAHQFAHPKDKEFTIRSRCRGHKTELDKIREGMGDWLFYGFANKIGGFHRWTVIDLDVFRGFDSSSDPHDIPNSDGTSFKAYWLPKLVTMNPGIIVPGGIDDEWRQELWSLSRDLA